MDQSKPNTEALSVADVRWLLGRVFSLAAAWDGTTPEQKEGQGKGDPPETVRRQLCDVYTRLHYEWAKVEADQRKDEESLLASSLESHFEWIYERRKETGVDRVRAEIHEALLEVFDDFVGR